MAGTDDREVEAKQILDRIARDDDALSSFATRSATRLRNHVSAIDADSADPIEQLGTRIGRTLGIVITVALAVWLIVLVLGG